MSQPAIQVLSILHFRSKLKMQELLSTNQKMILQYQPIWLAVDNRYANGLDQGQNGRIP